MAEHSTAQTSTQAPIMTPVPAEEPGSGHIEPGHETAGSGGYTGADGTTGYSNPDMSGAEEEHASLSPMIAAGEVALAAAVHAVAPQVALIVDGIAMFGGIGVETYESASHFGEGAGPAPSAPTASAAPAAPAAEDAGKTGVTSDGAGYSTVGEEPTSSSASGSFATDEPETEETINDFGTDTDTDGTFDTGTDDFGTGTDVFDAGTVDTATVDSAAVDTGTDAFDTSAVDTGAVDSAAVDSAAVDSAVVDAGAVDAGSAALPVDDFTPTSDGDLGLITDAEMEEA